MKNVKLQKNLLRVLKPLNAATVPDASPGQKHAVYLLILYSCQKIRVFGVKKKIIKL
jgi:hypothetical protein